MQNGANQKTNLFALGSAIYFMLKGYPPFPKLDSVGLLDGAMHVQAVIYRTTRIKALCMEGSH
jgi:hypothetical protein